MARWLRSSCFCGGLARAKPEGTGRSLGSLVLAVTARLRSSLLFGLLHCRLPTPICQLQHRGKGKGRIWPLRQIGCRPISRHGPPRLYDGTSDEFHSMKPEEFESEILYHGRTATNRSRRASAIHRMIPPMSIAIFDSRVNLTSMGLSFRGRTPGPESDLVDWFLATCPIRTPAGCRTTIFCEPRLESGFPDLVVVTWSPIPVRDWISERALLTCRDLRVLHFLMSQPFSSHGRLQELFPSKLKSTLDRLQAADLIRERRTGWMPRALSESFAVRSIVAIEAKIRNWRDGLEQAVLNTWFASHSYILLPHIPRHSPLLDEARLHGIGVWTRDNVRFPRSAPDRLPRSYVSWLFNEWAWRASLVTD